MRKIKNEELGRLSVEEFKQAEKSNFVIIADNIRSMNNIGSVFRTADAFLCNKIYLCGITPKPPHREIQKTALGATESVEWEHSKSIIDVIEKLRKDNYKIISVEQVQNAVQLNDFRPIKDEKYAFIFGNEVNGVSQETVDNSDFCIEIPQFGTKHSVNISISVGIVCWDYISKTKLK